ncbi:retrovirus-related pol polyprotein from transposon TNT 1-94 [Tanacetum coccineum]
MVSTVKLPILKKGEYTLWSMRMEQYLTNTDYSLWQVILNGDGPIQVTTDEKVLKLSTSKTAQHYYKDKENENLKALDEGYYSKKNLKVYKMIIKKDSEIVKAKVERKSIAIKAKKESSDEESFTSGSEDKEYAMAVRDFKKLFKRRGRFSDSSEEDDEKVKDETCLVAHASSEICLGVDLEPDEWIKDSGCSKHMTGNQKLFSTYKAYNGGNVIFGSNLRSNIIGKGTISNSSLKIDNVEHVDNLGFNLLSIGQICNNKCRVTFSEYNSEITKDGKVTGRGIRKKGLYVMKLGNKPKDQIGLTTIDENSTLWHRRLRHANMRLNQSLASKELVRNLPKLKFDQHSCDSCKMVKQAHASHKAKNVVSTIRCLELLHIDLFGPSVVRSYGGNRYTLIIVDDYSSQISSKDKTGLGYGDQLNENDSSGSELFNSVFDSRSSDGDDNQTNDRFKKDNGYHVVPPPLTGNYMPPLADLSFAGLDDSVYRPTANKTSASVSQVETSITPPSNTSVEMPRVESVRPSGVIIEDWVSDDDEDIFQSNDVQTTVKPSFKKIEFTKARNEPVKSDKQAVKPRMVTQSPKVDRKDWNGKMTQKLGLGFGFTKKACFVCGSHNHLIKDCDFHEKRMPKESVLGKGLVIGKSERIPVSTAKQVSKEKVNTVRVNGVNTTGQITVSTVKGNEVTAVKASAGCVWRLKMTDLNNGSKDNSESWISKRGNPQQALKYKGMFDSGCSRHMTRNKALLTNYQDIDGGFVAFGGSTRGGKITGIGKIRTNKIDFEDVFFMKELKFNLFSVSQMCDKKNNVLFTETEYLVLSPDFKLIDGSQVLLRVPKQNNMYSFDLKNVVPSGDLTCLFAKPQLMSLSYGIGGWVM